MLKSQRRLCILRRTDWALPRVRKLQQVLKLWLLATPVITERVMVVKSLRLLVQHEAVADVTKDMGTRGEGDGHRRRRKKATPAPEPAGKSEPVDKRAAKSSSSSGPGSGDSSEEDVAAEPASALAVPNVPPSALAMGTRPAAPVPAWLQSRVQDLTRKASVFARALTRAQQALRTSARIAREAAQSFESELENFQIASREIEKEFQGKH